jgi:hypothetical protein
VHVDHLPLGLSMTPARKRFKSLTGNNNHFLITIQVGLDAVASGEATLDPDFSTSWNPKDRRASAHRSREFAHKAMLTWLTDALSAYRSSLKRTPGLALDASTWERADSLDGLVAKLDDLVDQVGAPCGPERDLVCTAVVWRNRLVHEGASNSLPQATRQRLQAARDEIHENYQGLDITRTMETLKRSSDSKAPTFKETTALVRAAQKFVEVVDGAIVGTISPTDYLIDVLREHVRQDVVPRSANIWGKSQDRKRASIVQVAQSAGMSRLDTGGIPVGPRISALLAAEPREARRLLGLS